MGSRSGWLAGISFLTLSGAPSLSSYAADWSGEIGAELRVFPQAAAEPRQHEENLSLRLLPEFQHEWDEGKQSIRFAPFFRLDQGDEERTHFDVRELTWLRVAEAWELRLGVRKVFWGVTESQHLVDIINQTDFVENIDTEDKLGQPMLNLAIIQDWGTVDLFFLPYFRERTFPGRDGRPRIRPFVDGDQAQFESDLEEWHPDAAIRGAFSRGIWDVGLSHFYGTSREPRLIPALRHGEIILAPRYEVIHQSGLDAQATIDNWLWKLEVINRIGQGDTFQALTFGFEYTLVGVFESAVDLGVLAEYLYDNRAGEFQFTPFADDIFAGMRLALNDAQSTEALMGVIVNRESGARMFNVEASRRLGERFTLELEARFFDASPETEPLAVFRRDDYVQLDLAYHF